MQRVGANRAPSAPHEFGSTVGMFAVLLDKCGTAALEGNWLLATTRGLTAMGAGLVSTLMTRYIRGPRYSPVHGSR